VPVSSLEQGIDDSAYIWVQPPTTMVATATPPAEEEVKQDFRLDLAQKVRHDRHDGMCNRKLTF